jgi:hypothetical protein
MRDLVNNDYIQKPSNERGGELKIQKMCNVIYERPLMVFDTSILLQWSQMMIKLFGERTNDDKASFNLSAFAQVDRFMLLLLEYGTVSYIIKVWHNFYL